MKVNVRFLDNLKVEAFFDDFKVLTDQPVRYKGDGQAPSPFDYFLASSALCAAYFVKVYCIARDIPTDDIRLYQNNIVDPENRYKQIFDIQIELPGSLSEKHRNGILQAIDRCTVKKVIQHSPEFRINPVDVLGAETNSAIDDNLPLSSQTHIIGKDCTLEETIENMSSLLQKLGIHIEIASWRNPIPHVWSVHIRDADSPLCYTNGKGTSKNAALASALGEYIERISNNYFYNDYYLGEEVADAAFVHFPEEKWFPLPESNEVPPGLLDEYTRKIYDVEGELKASCLVDTNSGNFSRGICALPFIRQSDGAVIYFPVNILGNLYVSNGMSAGNTKYEARVQCLSEIFERAAKQEIISQELALPDVPEEILAKFPRILEGINKLETEGFSILVKDASMGGKVPVMAVTLLNPRTGGVFVSFGAHPKFEVALERSLTELLQGRSFEGMDIMPAPTFNSFTVQEHTNIVDHFVDSVGFVSWKFFSAKSDFDFVEWNFEGSTHEEYDYLMSILNKLEKEVYIADYDDLGAHACRIIVPQYSEIYPPEDLVWDNHNKALDFRADILSLHKLNPAQLSSLVERFDNSDIDDYTKVGEVIGVAFEEGTPWGLLTVLELKVLCLVDLKRFEDALEQTEMLLTFNDNLPERVGFFRALNTILHIVTNEELSIEEFSPTLSKLFEKRCLNAALKSVHGEVRFYGLEATDKNFKGLEKHRRMIESYKKLWNWRCSSKSGMVR